MQKRSLKHPIVAVMLMILPCLTACVPPPPTPDLPSSTQEKRPHLTLHHLNAWRITGAIAAKQKKKTWTASLSWQQRRLGDSMIYLFGPLGGGSISLEQKNGIFTYQDGKKTTKSAHAEQLIFQETGVHLPIQHLSYWIKGIPSPKATQSHQLDADGNLLTLNQAGYTLHYSAYTRVNGLSLPTKIHLQNADGTVKLVIKQWNISD